MPSFFTQLEIDRIQFEIKVAEKRLSYWIMCEEGRRKNPYQFSDAILFRYIHLAKDHRKQAQANLDYWKEQLTKAKENA